jgi:transcriptional regulator with XRE-family HTH domain
LRKALREHRLEKNLSYKELAAAIGAVCNDPDRVSDVTLCRFVEGATGGSDRTVWAVEKYLEKIAAEKAA